MEQTPKRCEFAAAPILWNRLGLVIERGNPGSFDSSVTGDPCIVWDEQHGAYHMFYFAQKMAGEHEVNANAHAICLDNANPGPGAWQKQGLINYVNPDDLLGDTHKPWILMDPYHPNKAASIDGKFWLFTVTYFGINKVVQLARSGSLDGPWVVVREPVISNGTGSDFDGYHADTITAYWFEREKKILLFYKGYPAIAQSDQPGSPFGSCNAIAVMEPHDKTACKQGKNIAVSREKLLWTSGWVGGMQIFPAANGGWYGLLGASPTPPSSVYESPTMREPAPALAGWAFTTEGWPVSGWKPAPQPLEWIDDIPEKAVHWGEGVNLWRHHILVMPDGSLYLYYNSGSYGQERLFGRHASANHSNVIWQTE
jgi:hypothetical protein